MSDESSKQIRPRKRVTSKPDSSSKVEKEDVEVESTRERLQGWMGLKSGTTTATSQERGLEAKKSPASILKAPKYSRSTDGGGGGGNTKTRSSTSLVDEDSPAISSSTAPETPVICKSIIVERDPTKPSLKRRPRNLKAQRGGPQQQQQQQQPTPLPLHASVEGHVPTTIDNKATATVTFDVAASDSSSHSPATAPDPAKNDENDDNDDDPLILNSVEDLFAAAGQALPDQRIISPDAQLVEADISFSVMTQQHYNGKVAQLKREQEQEREEQMRIFLGQQDAFGSNSGEEQVGMEEESVIEDDGDEHDDGLLEMLMEQDMSDEDDGEAAPTPPRAFRLVWDALSEWMTYESVEWMRQLQDFSTSNTISSHPPPVAVIVDRSDIGASRCAGLMAMIRLYLPAMMEELGHSQERRRTAEARLGDLLRTFDYSREAPKLPVNVWKAMTCILLDMVMIETRREISQEANISSAVRDTGMSMEEYRYLTQSALQTFAMSTGA